MKFRPLFLLLGISISILLAACSVTEPAPTLPPPPTPVTDAQPPAIVIEDATAVPDTDARETAVADSSPTPIHTPTLAPTTTPTEEPEPVIDPAQMPAISHDLLFVGNGKLKRWQRDGQVLVLLDGDVVDYSLSAGGKRAVVAQLLASTEISNTVTAVTETIHTYALSFLNLETGSSQIIVPAINSNGRPQYQISQDGKRAAVSGLSLGDPLSLILGDEVRAELYVMETETGQPPVKIRDCAGYCHNLVWHQDNNFFVFGDGDGLFLYNLAAKEPELLLGDDGSEFGLRFGPISWSKNGRWLLTWYEGAVWAIFDVPTKQVMVVPNTFVYAGPYFSELTWMADDRLFLVRLAGDESGPVVGETLRINPDAGQVSLDESVVLTNETMQPMAPMHWENGRFGYGLVMGSSHPEAGLYQRTAFNEPAERVSTLPAAAPQEIVWSPDGSGAVLQTGGAVYYAPVDGELVDLETAVGLRGHNFTWLP